MSGITGSVSGTSSSNYSHMPPWESFALAGRYNAANPIQGQASTVMPTNSRCYFTWCPIPADATISALALGLKVNGEAGARAHLAVASSVNSKPDTWLADFGEVVLDTGGPNIMVEAASTTLNVTRSMGGVWVACWLKNVTTTQATIMAKDAGQHGQTPMDASSILGGANPRGWNFDATYSASTLTGAVPTVSVYTAACPQIWLKVV